MLRDLLVHVNGDESGRNRVALAVDLAERTGAHLCGQHVMPPPEISPGYWPSGIDAAVAQFEAALARDASVARAIFADATAHSAVSAHWFEATGDIAKGISDRARFFDLVILGQNEAQQPPERHPLPIAHSVVLTCGRPVLVVPTHVESLVPVKVAIAWDGSREAVRAVHDALPLLKLAQTTDIVTMAKRSDDAGLLETDELVAHLAHHGISTIHRVEGIEPSDEHERLLVSIATGYDLIVMGGYLHLRWLEFIFGGPTISTLLTSKVPVLVSH